MQTVTTQLHIELITLTITEGKKAFQVPSDVCWEALWPSLGHLHLAYTCRPNPSQASPLRGGGLLPILLTFAHLEPKAGLPDNDSGINPDHHNMTPII